MMLGHGRRRTTDGENGLETWVQWMKRVTHEAEDALKKLEIDDWVTKVRRTRWNWARKVAEMDSERWASQIAQWKPQWSLKAARKRGRPKLRWSTDISAFLENHGHSADWLHVATQPETWSKLGEIYANAHAG